MPSQRTLHISFPENEVDLYNELMRESALTYSPIASVCRRRMRKDIEDKPLINREVVSSRS
tara:strand:- start:245 stop:427 length:183 start_codon:yes stop_codon:yes gene_type:complete